MGSPLLCVYPKMSEIVKEAADVVLLQPATEKPGLHEDLSLHTEIDCNASGCPSCLRLPPAVSQVQIQMRQPFISAHLLHAPRPVTFLAHPGPITAHFRDDVSSTIKNVPDAYIDRCRLGTHGNSLCSPPGHVTGPRIHQLHRQSAKNDGSGSCWLLTTS